MRIESDGKIKLYHAKNMFSVSKCKIDKEILIDMLTGNFSNVAKLGVNRKHAVIIDFIREFTFCQIWWW